MVGFVSRRSGAPLALATALLATLCLAGTSALAAELTPSLQGDALVRPQGADDFSPAHEGARVAPGSGVRTAAGTAALLKASEGVSIRLAPDTAVTLRPAVFLPVEQPGASPLHAFQFALTSGEVDLEVHDPGKSWGMIVVLPGGRSLALWRGSANVAIHGDRVAIALYEGTAIAGSASRWKPLTSGTGAVLAPDSEPSTRPTPGIPLWADAASAPAPPFAIVRGDERATLGAAWQPAVAAASYRVEVGPDARMVGPMTIVDTDAPSMKTAQLPAGSYFARVRAISSAGIAGPTSTPKALRVTRFTVPALAFSAAEGAIVLPGPASVTLDDPRDLEVATVSEFDPTAEPRWTPAPSEISLGGGTRRIVRLRHIPSRIETRLLLVKRELRAHISFSPAGARWPDNPVDVIVRVEDVSGYLDPAQEPVTFDVRVDLEKLNLTWNHTGETWTARIAPRPPPGPWVIRVDVQDRAGVPIGASLLDVDGPRVERPSRRGNVEGLQVER
jgi:hypothetical protein